MGGKTQQRVAGNAKPTNSGRIRGLLVNQQLASGNIITFSALSAKNKQINTQLPVSKSPPQPESNDNEAQSSEAKQQLATTSQKQPKSILHTTTPSTKDNTRLIVRRVGDRDFYTRVRFADEQQTNGDGSSEQVAVRPSDAGVKKPSFSLDDSIVVPGVSSDISATSPSDKEVELDLQSKAQAGPEQHDDELEEESEQESDKDEKLNFDELLDRLGSAKALVEQTSRVKSLGELNETSIEHESKLLDIFMVMLRKFSNEMSIEDWDLLVCSLNKWVKWVSKSDHPLRKTYHADLCAKVFKFIHQLIMFAEQLQQDTEHLEYLPMMQSLLDDWANFRSSSMFLDLISLYLKLISTESSEHGASPNQTIQPMIEALAHIIVTVDPRMVLSHHSLFDYLSPKIEFDSEFKAPPNSIFCKIDEKKFKGFLAVCGLLRSNSRVILVTAHAILNKVLDSVCENAQSLTLISDHEAVDDVLIFPLAALMAILTSRDSMMSALLSDYRVGDISVTMEPNTDSYGCALSYLFAWDLAIQFIVGVDKEVSQCMIHSLKKLGLIQRLLDNIFMLLPPLDQRDSLNFRFELSDRDIDKDNQTWCIKQFLNSPLKTTIKRPVNEIELVALHLYFSVALHMPVTVRKWYNNNSNKKLCNLVNEYTVKHISQLICSIEMESVLEKCHERVNRNESNNLTIKARPSAKEVYAIYTRDEFKMELTIKLPLNYPLGSVQIDGGKRVGVTDVKWRSWLLQLTTFLAHQNGPILDGIDLWRKNIDKRFEGVEKCTICFSILHSNYQLPKKKCQTCANMFHNLCLYKWFESSGNSTCPLCRNPW